MSEPNVDQVERLLSDHKSRHGELDQRRFRRIVSAALLGHFDPERVARYQRQGASLFCRTLEDTSELFVYLAYTDESEQQAELCAQAWNAEPDMPPARGSEAREQICGVGIFPRSVFLRGPQG